ncbi:creatininase family protein [Candidatus Chloroploca asiatica]|uniref:Creatinine amidohydrolase n=1 Tax=Candidatus Chloroploca asiatica TaxID=1506545 RepID=A0A2H3KKE7_9CHLR|nr:creatininase family protein [Candidatus Chloroploca asiatica]PDV98478.1 hypothetical protein A9Q02_15360 [Candidatus Chloroploca asiatica]
MAEKPPWGRYNQLLPTQLAAIRAAIPVIYLPWGSLMWHGPHLPFGLDTLVIEAMAERAVQRTGGVLLPTMNWASDGIPHPDNVTFNPTTLNLVLDDLLAQLAATGWRVIVLLNGHYGYSHDQFMMEAAQRALHQHQVLVLAITPLTMVDEAMLDHGGLWGTSLLLALRPDLVDLETLGNQPLQPETSGVVGRDPRYTAAATLGTSALNLAVERIVVAVQDLVKRNDPAQLIALYEQRHERYQAFLARYGSDPAEVTARWWAALTQGE